MKRFVDLRHVEMGDSRFAWWDTVTNKFETHSGNMAWSSWGDFARDYRGTDLDRYKALFPWPLHHEPYDFGSVTDETLLRLALSMLRACYSVIPDPLLGQDHQRRQHEQVASETESERLARKGRLRRLIDKLEARLQNGARAR